MANINRNTQINKEHEDHRHIEEIKKIIFKNKK